jgi:hypothetical protein
MGHEDGANLAEYIQTLFGYWSLATSAFAHYEEVSIEA